MNPITQRINEKNYKLYGAPCESCGLFTHSCRCDSFPQWYATFKSKPTLMNYIDFRKNAFRTLSNIDELYNYGLGPSVAEEANMLHCIIGIMTEVHELEAGMVLGDEVNMKEELGDLMWYIANYDNVNRAEYEHLPEINLPTDRFDLSGIKESAELLLDMWKKRFFYMSDKYDTMIENTFANLKHACIRFANANGWNLSAIMNTNIEKLKERYPEKFTTKDADNRDLDAEREILEK